MIKTTCKTIYLNVAVLESILKDHITMKFSENIIEKNLNKTQRHLSIFIIN